MAVAGCGPRTARDPRASGSPSASSSHTPPPGLRLRRDRASFIAWASDLAAHGPGGFYGRGFFVDYTPGYLYVLWLVGIVGSWLGGIGDLIKIPAILADVAVAWLVHRSSSSSAVAPGGAPRAPCCSWSTR